MLRLAIPHKRTAFWRHGVSLRIGQNVINEERPTHGSTYRNRGHPKCRKVKSRCPSTALLTPQIGFIAMAPAKVQSFLYKSLHTAPDFASPNIDSVEKVP